MFLSQTLLLIMASGSTLSEILSDSARDNIVNFPCQAGFFPFAMAKPTVCSESEQSGRVAQVSCLGGGLVDKLGAAKFVDLDRPLATDDILVVIGTPPKVTVMEMSLFSGDDIVMYMTARFDHNGVINTVIMNSDIGGWGAEEVPATFPYTAGVQFNTTIVVKASDYQIFVDDVLLHTYAFRDPTPSVTKIRFWGDILVNSFFID